METRSSPSLQVLQGCVICNKIQNRAKRQAEEGASCAVLLSVIVESFILMVGLLLARVGILYRSS